jgi:hypothetical protein
MSRHAPNTPARLIISLVPLALAGSVLACGEDRGPRFRSENLEQVTESLAQSACTRATECGTFVIQCSGSDYAEDADDAGSEPQCEVEARAVEYSECISGAAEEFAASIACFNEDIVAAASACYSAMMEADCPTEQGLEAALAAGSDPTAQLEPACEQLMTLSSQCAASSRPSGLFPEDGANIHAAPATVEKMSSMPCGERTLATLEVSDGHYLFFCDLGDGSLSMGEAGPLHESSVMADQVFECPLDVFEAFAPDGVVPPEALVADCETRSRLASAGNTDANLDLRQHVPVKGSHYCSTSGASEFDDERCDSLYYPGAYPADCSGIWYKCSSWCLSAAIGWHQRSSEGQMGQKVDKGVDVVASCGGTTRFRGWWDGDQVFDNTVLANYWQWHGLGPDGDVTVVPDHEIKFRGDSSSGAYHRATGALQDYNWP